MKFFFISLLVVLAVVSTVIMVLPLGEKQPSSISIPVDTNLGKESGTSEKDKQKAAPIIPTIAELTERSNRDVVDGEPGTSKDINELRTPSNIVEEDIEAEKPIGYASTADDWAARKIQAKEAEAFLLADDMDKNSPEMKAYLQEWEQSVLNDREYIDKVEGDARRLKEQLGEVQESPSLEKLENIRVQGEEAERLLMTSDEN